MIAQLLQISDDIVDRNQALRVCGFGIGVVFLEVGFT